MIPHLESPIAVSIKLALSNSRRVWNDLAFFASVGPSKTEAEHQLVGGRRVEMRVSKWVKYDSVDQPESQLARTWAEIAGPALFRPALVRSMSSATAWASSSATREHKERGQVGRQAGRQIDR